MRIAELQKVIQYLFRYTVSSGSQVILCACRAESMTRELSLDLSGSLSIGQSVKSETHNTHNMQETGYIFISNSIVNCTFYFIK